MDSFTYKKVTSLWNVKRRNVLEDTLALVESRNEFLADKLKACIRTAPIEKPAEHTGGSWTDYFLVEISESEAQDLIDLLFDLEAAAVPQSDGLDFEKEAIQQREASRIASLVDEWNKLNTQS